MKIRTSMIAAVILTSLTGIAKADWPQFAGSDRNSMSKETGLLRSWPQAGPKVLWTFNLGEGFGGAAIRDGQVFLLDRTGATSKTTGSDVLRCMDLTGGKELWSYSYAAPGKTGFNGSRAVPAVTEKAVFAVGPFGDFNAIDRTTHKPLWTKTLMEPGFKMANWGIAQSPLIYKDLVIVSPQAKAGGLAAYDQATGELKWQAADVPSTAYCSPLLLTIGGVEQIVLTHGKGVAAVDPSTGKLLWSYGGWKCGIPIPTVTQLDDGKLFVTGGYKAGSAMIQVTANAGTFSATELWKIPQGSQIHQPILVDGALYFNGNTNDTPKEGLICLNPADGKIIWQSGPTPALDRCDLILADGMFYLQDAAGNLNLVQPNKEAFKLVSTVKLFAGKDIWAPMALTDGKLVLRDQTQMKCLDIKAAK